MKELRANLTKSLKSSYHHLASMDGFSYEGNGAVTDRHAPERRAVTAIIARLLKKERY